MPPVQLVNLPQELADDFDTLVRLDSAIINGTRYGLGEVKVEVTPSFHYSSLPIDKSVKVLVNLMGLFRTETRTSEVKHRLTHALVDEVRGILEPWLDQYRYPNPINVICTPTLAIEVYIFEIDGSPEAGNFAAYPD